jgi:hypothetical protein
MNYFGKEVLVTRWWITKNKNFSYKTPLEVYAENPETVDAYIRAHFNIGTI